VYISLRAKIQLAFDVNQILVWGRPSNLILGTFAPIVVYERYFWWLMERFVFGKSIG
tara:strand:+ start:172 stop:342 length:171 start_codon:yes stop_codon:yes gene_type:complete